MFPAALAKPKHWPFIALFFIGWSGAIELLQPYVNRYGEWLDLLANSLGILASVLLIYFFELVKKRVNIAP